MTPDSTEQLFRQAGEAEEGMPVSAGARVSHLRLALATGRAYWVDLSGIPANQRPVVVAEIKDIVKRAGRQTPRNDAAPTSNAPNVNN